MMMLSLDFFKSMFQNDQMEENRFIPLKSYFPWTMIRALLEDDIKTNQVTHISLLQLTSVVHIHSETIKEVSSIV